MDIKRLNPRIATSPQIRPTDIEAIARAGYRSIICNRPDGEEQRQSTAKDIESAARGAGLGFAHIPVVS
jgi:sulfide:quinone oxidoreductase